MTSCIRWELLNFALIEIHSRLERQLSRIQAELAIKWNASSRSSAVAGASRVRAWPKLPWKHTGRCTRAAAPWPESIES